MAKQLNSVNVNLAFTADTSAAQMQLQTLQKQLTNLINMPTSKLNLEGNIKGAVVAAAELKSHLTAAMNTKTGTLDFSKLNQSINASGKSLSQYAAQLQSLGPQGQQAFISLANAIASSEIPIRRSNALLKEMGTTLMNTARWQLSSSILHGFMGAVQTAYGYAQDLNESLNNIRIVTSQNTDQMAKFAEQANKAAKALSTTTTEYTNASLIYYQQGLTDQQVKDRTDITIKMANVARESAQTVSDQMTAVWNNFYDGSKSLEHYADVMTALGAATASSTSEISEGLNKFSAVAETVGLSYEYAASALATVTSTTRQSADVVGTAFKTLFARIQDLELGNTLDDGTTLGSYSQALAKVGVQIKDVSGEMKSMDVILEEMAARWTTLGKSEQVALAQSVAGVRQYTQLIALMENWDFMEQNLATAESSSGALQKQADVYAESWEAASDRVTVAAEAIYSNLISDEFFIDLLNDVEKILNFVNELIDSLGGLEGTLTTIGAIVTKVFHDSMATGLKNMAYNIQMMTTSGQRAIQNARTKELNKMSDMIVTDPDDPVQQKQASAMRDQVDLQTKMTEMAEKMNSIELSTNQALLDRVKILQDQSVNAEKNLQKAKKQTEETSYQAKVLLSRDKNPKQAAKDIAEFGKQQNRLQKNVNLTNMVSNDMRNLVNENETLVNQGQNKKNTQQIFNSFKHAAEKLNDTQLNDIISEIEKVGRAADLTEDDIAMLQGRLNEMTEEAKTSMVNLVGDDPERQKQMRSTVDDLANSFENQANKARENGKATRAASDSVEDLRENLNEVLGKQHDWSNILVSTASAVMSFSSSLSMLSSLWDTLKDPDTSGWEKFLSIFTTLGMVIPMVITGWKSLQEAEIKETVVKGLNVAASKILEKQKLKEAAATTLNKESQEGETRAQLKDIVVNKLQALSEKSKQTWGKIKTGTKELPGKIKGGLSTIKGGLSNVKGLFSGTLSNAGATTGSSTLTTGGAALGASIAAIAAAIAVVVGAIAFAVHQANKAERAVEKAKKSAEELQNNYDTVKASYDEFTNATSNYENAVDSVEKLTKGTQEYEDAVRTANEAAMQLLETNDNLAYTIEDGQIVIDEQSLENEKLKERQKLETANAAKIAGQNQLRLVEEDLAKRDMAREQLKSAQGEWQHVGNAVGMALAGALAGAILAPLTGGLSLGFVAAILGGAAGATASGLTGTSSAEENEALEKLEAAYLEDETILQQLKDGTIDWGKIGIEDTALRDSLQKNADEVSELIKEMAANTTAIQAQNDAIVANALVDNANVQSSKFQDEIIDITGDAYGKAYDEAMQSDWVDTWGKEGLSQINKTGGTAKQVFSEYLKYAGLEDQGYTLVDTTGTDANRKFVYKDKQGNEQTVSLETMQAARAAYEASGKIDEVANILVQKFAQLEYSGQAKDQALLSFLSTKNFENTTTSEIEAMREAVQDDGASAGELKELLSVDDLEIAAKQYGYDSAEEFIEAFNNKLNDAEKALGEVAIEGMSKELTSNLTIGLSKKLNNIIDTMNTGALGEAAGQEFIWGLNTMLEGVDTQKQQEALARIAEIDWSAYDAGKQAREIIEELGGAINMTDEEFQEWVHNMNMANLAVPNADKVIEDMEKIKKLSEDTNLGDVISQEDYELLIAYNNELAKFFTILADGSAMMTGDPLDFLQVMKESQIQYLTNAIEEEKAYAAVLESRRKAGMDKLGITDENAADQYLGFTSSGTNEAGDITFGIDKKRTQMQLDFLKSQGYDEKKLTAWQKDLDDNDSVWTTTANGIAEAMEEHISNWKSLDEQIVATTEHEQAYLVQMAMTAESAEERQKMLEQGLINAEAYAAAAQSAMMQEAWEGLEVEEVQEYASYLRDAFGLAEEQAEEVARATMKMDIGVQTLMDNWEDWSDILKNSSKTSQEYAKTINGIKNALSDMLDVSEKFITSDFIEDEANLELIQQAAEGSTEALDQLGIALSESIAKQAILSNTDIIGKDAAIAEVETAMDRINEILSQDLPDLKVGEIVDEQALLTQMNAVVEAAKMTVEQANAYYRSMGFTPKFKTETLTADSIVPLTTTVHSRDYSKDVYDDEGRLIGWTESEYSLTSQGKAGEYGFPAVSMGMQTGDGKEYQIPSTQIESLTYTGGGSMSNSSSVNAGGKKSSSKKSKRKNEIDRYHEISETLDDLNRQYDQISKAKDRAFGANKLALMDLEIEKTKELANAQQQYISEIQSNLATDKSVLMGYGAEFDESGRISNYEELMNSNIDLSDEQWEEFQSALSQYEETLNLLEAEQIEFIDLQNQMFDLSLEKIQYEVEIKVSVNDRELKMLEYQLEQLDDPLYDAATAITNLGQSLDLNFANSDEYTQRIKDILGETIPEEDLNKILGGDFSSLENYTLTESQIKALDEYADALYNVNGNLDTLYEGVGERVRGAFEELNEQMRESTSTLNHLGEILNGFRNIVDLVGKDVLGLSNESMEALSQSMTNNAINTVEANKKILDTNKAALAEAETKRQEALEAGDMKAVAEWDKTIDTLSETVKQNEVDVFGGLSEALQAAADQYKTTMEGIVEDFEKSMSGSYGSFDAMQQAYDQQSELSDLYVKDYEKIYELSKLNRDINKSIDGTSNIKAKQELMELQEEINELSKDGAKVSEYDLEHLRKKYDLRLAEIALEEAQNAKSQVRMQRDSEGNWSYVYTADEDKMADAQQNYEDKLFELQDFNESYIKEQEEALLQLQQDYVNAISNIHAEDYETYDEYLAAIEQVNTHYNALFEARGAELGKAIDNNKILYDEEWEKYKDTTDLKIESDGDLTTSFSDTKLALIGGYESISGMQESFKTATSNATTEMGNNYNSWKTNVDNAMTAAGLSLDGFETDVQEAVADINTESDKAVTDLNEIALSGSAAFKSVVDAAADQYTTYSKTIDDYKTKNLELIQTLNTLIQKAGEVNNLDFNTETPGSNPDVETTKPSGTGGNDKTKEPEIAPPNGTNEGITVKRYHDPTANTAIYGDLTLTSDNKDNYNYGYNSKNDSYYLEENGRYYYLDDEDVAKLKQAGYKFTDDQRTSTYTSSNAPIEEQDSRFKVGDKIASKEQREEGGLNQVRAWKKINNDNFETNIKYWEFGSSLEGDTIKEIVQGADGYTYYRIPNAYENEWFREEQLVPFDTGGYTGSWNDDSGRLAMLHQKELVLNASDTANMLQVVDIVRDIVKSIDLNAGAQAIGLGYLSANTANGNNQVIQQEVTIKAEFPNATDHFEIEQAFDNLINRASQFANRKNK